MGGTKFNHCHITFHLPQDHLTKRSQADDYFRNSLDLNIYRPSDDISSIFRTIDARPRECANNLCHDLRAPFNLTALVAVCKSIRKSEGRLRDIDALIAHSYVGWGEHFSISVGRVSALKIDGEMLWGEKIARTMLLGFPQGALLLCPEWSRRLCSMDDKLGFIGKNASRIEAASKKHRHEGGQLQGCGVLLGFQSLVTIHDVVTLVASSKQSLLAPSTTTSSKASTSGCFIVDALERDLVRTMWRTVRHSQRAYEAGESLEDWLAEKDPAILRRRRIYQGFESLTQRAVEMRKHIRNNVVVPDVPVKAFSDTFESTGDCFGQLVNDSAFVAELPDAVDPPAFKVNGDPVTADNLLFLRKWDMPSGSAVVTFSPAELTLISHQLQSHCNRRSMQDILTKVQKSLDPLYTSHVDLNLEEGYSKKYATIKSATYLNLIAKDILFNAPFPDTFEAITSNLSTHFPRYGNLEMRTVIAQVATYSIFLPLMGPDRLLVEWGGESIKRVRMTPCSSLC